MKIPTPRLDSCCTPFPLGTIGNLEIWNDHFRKLGIGHEFLAPPSWWA